MRRVLDYCGLGPEAKTGQNCPRLVNLTRASAKALFVRRAVGATVRTLVGGVGTVSKVGLRTFKVPSTAVASPKVCCQKKTDE